jgi:hypothetical protein
LGSLAVRSVLGMLGFSKVNGALEKNNADPRRSEPVDVSELLTMLGYHPPPTQNRITIATTTTTAAGRAPKAQKDALPRVAFVNEATTTAA